jgi:hypothetical protein
VTHDVSFDAFGHDRFESGLPRLVLLNHRRPPYPDVLVGLTENSAVASSVHVDGNVAPNPVHREFGRAFCRRDRSVPYGLAAGLLCVRAL